ncbi:hypothetical protein OROMI_025245 [Orobanche minor]
MCACADFPPPSTPSKILPVVAGLLLLFLLRLAYLFLWRRWIKDQELTLLDLQKGEFTYGQLAAIKNNFDVVNRLGKCGNATVYKGTLLDSTIVGIKKVKNRSKIKDDQRFINEVGLITALRHPNLLRLYGCCIERQDLLLVYEYMENNSLSEALYGTRV